MAERTRLQMKLLAQGFQPYNGDTSVCCDYSRNQHRKRKRWYSECGYWQELHEVLVGVVDDYWIKNKAYKRNDGIKEIDNIKLESVREIKGYGLEDFYKSWTRTYSAYSSDDSDSDHTISIGEELQEGSTDSSSSKARLEISNKLRESSFEEGSDVEEKPEIKHTDNIDLEKKARCGSADFPGTGTHTYLKKHKKPMFLDSGLIAVIPKEEEKELDEEEAQEDLQMSKQYDNESQNSAKSASSCSSKSESDNLADFEYSLPNKKVFVEIIKKEDGFGSVDSQESTHSLAVRNMKKMSKKAMDSFPNNYADEKASVNGEIMNHSMKAEHENVIKDHELKKDGGSANAILDSIIKDADILGKENDACIPLKFKFDDSDDDSSSQATNDPDVEGLFQEMGFLLECEAIGSYRTPTPTAESVEKDDHNDDTKTSVFKLCQRGDHKDVYLEEQTGMRCRLCGAVVVESKYVIPKLANITPDKSEVRSYQQLPTSTNLNYTDSDYKLFEICKQTEGTVRELIPARLQEHMYPHQQEGFKFLWENLAGTTELSGLQKAVSYHMLLVLEKPYRPLYLSNRFLRNFPNVVHSSLLLPPCF